MTPQRGRTASLQSLYWGLLLLGLVLALVGYFGPWVYHRTAALTVTGFELSWFSKFFPQVGSGVVSIQRERFFVPVVTAAILWGLWINRLAELPIFHRVLLTGPAALLLLLVLPPYDFFLTPEYRPQLLLAVGGMALIPLTLLGRVLPGRAWGGLFALLSLTGGSLALTQFLRLRPLVVSLHGSPVGLGWGAITCVAGFAALAALGFCVGFTIPER
jgi:hypothetical protein